MKTYKVKTNGLNIRSGPGTDHYEIIGQLTRDENVIVPDLSDWIPIALDDNSIGWVAEKYLEEVTATVKENLTVQSSYDFTAKDGTIAAIEAECIRQGITLDTQIAYVLATVEHETAGTFKPVKEAYWKDEAWRKANLRYFPYYGRGFVQITHNYNYEKYGKKLNIDLIASPDLAMESINALFILVDGFKTGAFTGKKITDFINEDQTDFVNARRCINGTDKAEEIAELAEKYLSKMDNSIEKTNTELNRPIWLDIAIGELGQKEIDGEKDNPRITGYFKATNYGEAKDEVPWCSAFINWIMDKSNIKGTRSAAALSWLDWGKSLEKPKLGCIVVFSRDGGGHVGLFLDEDENEIFVLGGNQSNAVTKAWYPKDRLRGYRWPKEQKI